MICAAGCYLIMEIIVVLGLLRPPEGCTSQSYKCCNQPDSVLYTLRSVIGTGHVWSMLSPLFDMYMQMAGFHMLFPVR